MMNFVTFQVTPGLARGTFPPKKAPVSMENIVESFSFGKLADGGAFSARDGVNVFLPRKIHGFIDAVSVAFDEHYPLVLRPQHFWVLITQAVAQHVNLNADALRSRFVGHEGKTKLTVERDNFTRGRGAKNDWAGVVCGAPDSFVEQIRAHLVAGAADDVMPGGFSGTTDVELVAMGITVMDTLKHFFEYRVTTDCGFPSITMEGTEADWRLLRSNAERLIRNRCMPAFAAHWSPILLPLLDKFVDEYRKAATAGADMGSRGDLDAGGDEKFWNSILKRGARHGSGGYTYLSGWINLFFPIIREQEHENPLCKPYTEIVGESLDWGMDISSFPDGMSRAPVEWEFYGSTIELDFNAGFLCAQQNPVTGIVGPHVGWFVTENADKVDKAKRDSCPFVARNKNDKEDSESSGFSRKRGFEEIGLLSYFV